MSERSHFDGVVSVARELVAAGADVRIWTDAKFAAEVAASGATFADLYAFGTVDSVDDRTRPLPARSVTFAAARGRQIADAVGAWNPALVLHDGFALIGRVVAVQLGLPRVLVMAGHAVDAPAFRAGLATDPRVSIDPRCHAAAARLRDEFGLADASPFSYVSDPSPDLNIYKEPREWLPDERRAQLEPLVHFGSLSRSDLDMPPPMPSPVLRLYASFGTIVWRYYTREALALLRTIAQAASERPSTRLLVSLGGARIDDSERQDLASLPGVKVADYANQRDVLAATDLFFTHHGLASTHEAVAYRVPMVSCPFFWDQPGLAQRAKALGVALPLRADFTGARDSASVEEVRNAVARAVEERTAMHERLEAARAWEARTLGERPAAVERILSLVR